MENILVDSHERVMKKLRVSLLDACNLRCVYCMPENAVFSKKEERIPYQKLISIIENLVTLGMNEVRLTGGEPTLSPDFMNIVRGLNHLNLDKFALTTNGINLKRYLPEIANTKLNSINFSLDTLDSKKFKKITRVDGLSKVMESIDLAMAYGLSVKINTVLMKNVNSDEILDLVRFSRDKGIELRFLETMNIGVVKPHFERWFMSAKEMIAIISQELPLTKLESPLDSTSINYTFDGRGKIGFIASESQPFCGGCSRLRLDAKGLIHPCLFKNDGLSLVDIGIEKYGDILPALIAKKPTTRIQTQETPMYRLGG